MIHRPYASVAGCECVCERERHTRTHTQSPYALCFPTPHPQIERVEHGASLKKPAITPTIP